MRDDRLRRSLEDLFSELSAPAPEGEAELLIPPLSLAAGIPPVEAEQPDERSPTQPGRAEEKEERK